MKKCETVFLRELPSLKRTNALLTVQLARLSSIDLRKKILPKKVLRDASTIFFRNRNAASISSMSSMLNFVDEACLFTPEVMDQVRVRLPTRLRDYAYSSIYPILFSFRNTRDWLFAGYPPIYTIVVVVVVDSYIFEFMLSFLTRYFKSIISKSSFESLMNFCYEEKNSICENAFRTHLYLNRYFN